MKITCQSCQSKYTVSDEKVQGKTVKIKCRKCGATIVVNSSGAQNGAGISDPVSGSGETSYLVNVAEGDQRSMSIAEVINAYNQQVINGETYVWADGMGDWQPLAQVDAIVSALGGVSATPAPEVASAPPEAPAYEPPQPMAAAPVSQSSVPPAAEPRAAAVRRDAPRKTSDLFGGGGGLAAQTEVASSAPLYNGGNGMPPPAASGTGARDENSVLFSLSALTAKAVPSQPRTTATKDDSGLIDLKALAENSSAPSPNAVPDHAGALFPLGVPAAPIVASTSGGFGSIAPGADTPKSKAPIFIGLGAVVAIAAIVGAFFAMKGSGEKPVPTTDPVATTAPAIPTTEPTVAASASVAAADTATPTASASASAAPKKGPGKVAGGPGPARTNTTPPPPKTADTPPPKKGNTCGCAANDLMCAMNCSAKGH